MLVVALVFTFAKSVFILLPADMPVIKSMQTHAYVYISIHCCHATLHIKSVKLVLLSAKAKKTITEPFDRRGCVRGPYVHKVYIRHMLYLFKGRG